MSYNPSEVIFRKDFEAVYFTSGQSVNIPLDCKKIILDMWQNGGAQQISNNQIRMRVNGSSANQYSYALRYVNGTTYSYSSTTSTSWPLGPLTNAGTPSGSARVILYPRKDAARRGQGELEYVYINSSGTNYGITGYLRHINTVDAITSIKIYCTVANTVSLSMMVRAIK